ncbi:histidine--tRNA ligase [Sphingomicrobium clamense]|uniref:Histidine--tRNA ligase n=1 Tax=Sphingomicrobium clamense TaxID=2851013 RepID=A0ABS6V2P7_9SPHN|nr:histidine--tRNA ligase [Sphingomicrobium sp. B8]MBW0143834.1 histidine--tRNA ligase [Sphingomicrobium sp. B8]
MNGNAKIRPVKGMQSLYGEDADRFAHVVETFEEVRRLYNFKRVEVPVLEQTAVFARTMGETTDVVSKEMWSFESRSEGSVTMRPEFTAGISRAFLSEGWQQHAPMKVATHGPAFRYERPQKGRYRQFHQLDAEIIGSADPLADVELLAFGAHLLAALGIEGVTLKLNTLGDQESRENWRGALVDYFSAHKAELSEDSQDRLEKNPLRILDSKDPRDQAFVADAPKMVLTDEAEAFFVKVREGLDAAGIAYELDPHLVRGLDYYRHTAFEFVTDQLGAQGTVLAGGRYDGLIEALGGSPTPAVGWAAGIERLAMLVDDNVTDKIEAAILPMGEAALAKAIEAAAYLRGAGFAAEIYATGKIGKRMGRADEAGARAAIVIGDDEIANGVVQYKDLATGEQTAMKLEEVVAPLTEILGREAMEDIEAMMGDQQ